MRPDEIEQLVTYIAQSDRCTGTPQQTNVFFFLRITGSQRQEQEVIKL
jgi:hypothetical protein